MDIGNQQRVIIVEVEEVRPRQPEPVADPVAALDDLEASAAAWPLPLDFDPEPVR